MKNALSLSLLLAAALLPVAPVEAEPLGIYVAPRLVAGQLKSQSQYAYSGSSQDQEKWTYGGALAVGYDFSPSLKFPLRVELEYGGLSDVKRNHNTHEVEEEYLYRYDYRSKTKVTLGVRTLFVNAYFDWHNTSAFTPYASVGLGMSFLDAKAKATATETGYEIGNPSPIYSETNADTYGKKTTTNAAWNIGLGGALRLSDTVALDLGYRYANLGKAKTKLDDPGWSSKDYYKVKTVETHQLLLSARFTF